MNAIEQDVLLAPEQAASLQKLLAGIDECTRLEKRRWFSELSRCERILLFVFLLGQLAAAILKIIGS